MVYTVEILRISPLKYRSFSIIKQIASRSLLISAISLIALHTLRQRRNKARCAERDSAFVCKEYFRFRGSTYFCT